MYEVKPLKGGFFSLRFTVDLLTVFILVSSVIMFASGWQSSNSQPMLSEGMLKLESQDFVETSTLFSYHLQELYPSML